MVETLEISSRTRVATLLLMCPEALEVLIGFDPHLESLRSAAKCRMIAHRLSLADVAYESGTPVEEIVRAVSETMGMPASPS
ncbi:MAG: hypothetical protein KDH09_07360 [Chrysiogenetes bacterium]|nr:hypothetical protein [Chrysiogenetes bacterium]